VGYPHDCSDEGERVKVYFAEESEERGRRRGKGDGKEGELRRRDDGVAGKEPNELEGEKPPETAVISLSNASTDEETVMIECGHTFVAVFTVMGPKRRRKPTFVAHFSSSCAVCHVVCFVSRLIACAASQEGLIRLLLLLNAGNAVLFVQSQHCFCIQIPRITPLDSKKR